MRSLRKDHDRLVDQGRVRFGTFDHAIEQVNLEEADAFAPWPVPKWLRRLRLKEWQAFQITHPRFFIIVALFDAKLVSLVQIKVYDRLHKKKYMLERKLLSGSFQAPRQLRNSVCEWSAGDEFMRFENKLEDSEFRVAFRIAASKDMPEVSAQLHATADTTTPLVVSIPFAENRGMYSHKALLPVTGTLSIGTESIEVEHGSASLMTDDHKGYYGRIMTWDWVVGAAWRDGVLTGFNLTNNASIDPQKYNENGFWIDGVLHELPPVQFQRSEDSDPHVWTIRDEQGLVDLRFVVEVDGRLFQNFVVVESRYQGPFGHFEGQLTSLDGQTLHVDNYFGMGERFWLKS